MISNAGLSHLKPYRIRKKESQSPHATIYFLQIEHIGACFHHSIHSTAAGFRGACNFKHEEDHDQKCPEIRASCFSTLDRFSGAIQDHETVARTKPLWASDYLAKEANLLSRMNMPNEALVVAERAVIADPTDCGAQMVKGTCLEKLGRYGEAVEALTISRNLAKKTISTKVESTLFLSRSLEKRANCYKKMGRIAESERDKIELNSYSDKLMEDLVGK